MPDKSPEIKEIKFEAPTANLRIRPRLKTQIDVEAGGRNMPLADFAEVLWSFYVDNRPDMVIQNPDGTISIVEIKRSAKTDKKAAEAQLLAFAAIVQSMLRGFASLGSDQESKLRLKWVDQRDSLKKSQPISTAKRVELHSFLDHILNSGNEEFIDGIKANLESWGRVARAESTKGFDDSEIARNAEAGAESVADELGEFNSSNERPEEDESSGEESEGDNSTGTDSGRRR